MKRRLSMIVLLSLPVLGSGCSMCCSPYDYHYATTGGSHQRMEPEYGRVGSIFSDPTAGYYGAGPDSNLDQDKDGKSLERINPLERDGELPRGLESIDPIESNFDQSLPSLEDLGT